MHSTRGVCEDLASQADVCTRMGSAFFGALLERAAGAYENDAALRDLLDRHAHRSRIGGAAHYPSTGGDCAVDAAWRAVLADVHANVRTYDELLERPVQTNEVARSMPVLGAMLALAHATHLPLRIFEIGSSAGLLLNFDRYYYSGEGWTWGDARSGAHLRNSVDSGAPAHLDAPLEVLERHGCDLNPLDPSTANGACTLLGFIWPDQTERFNRLHAALEIARAHPVEVVRADGITWSRTAASPRDGSAAVLLHAVVTEHLTPSQRESLRETITDLAARAKRARPFAWVRMEAARQGYHTTLTHWPAGEETVIAASDGHAQHLRWNP